MTETTTWWVDAYTAQAPKGFPENTWGPYIDTENAIDDVRNVMTNSNSGIVEIRVRKVTK